MLIPVNAIYVIGMKTKSISLPSAMQLYTETGNKVLSEVGISCNDCTKTMFVNLLISNNEQLIQRLAQLITYCFEIRSLVKG